MKRRQRGTPSVGFGVLAGLVAAFAFLACLPAATFASGSYVPRWLKPPYEHYTLTYEANDSSHGTIESSTPNPPPGFGVCEFVATQQQGSQTVHAVVRYAFVFGRYRGKLAFSYRLAGRSASGRAAITGREGYLPSCPAGGRFPEGPQGAECWQSIGFDDPPELELGANPAQTRFGLSLAVSLDTLNEPACTGSPQAAETLHPTSFDFGGENGGAPLPGVAYMNFTAAGIERHRTFHGNVATKPEKAARSGGGTVPQSGGEQVVWSFADSPAYTLTLAPAAHG